MKQVLLYKLGQVHQETKNGLPPLCPIFSPTGTATCKLMKILLPFSATLAENEYNIPEICKQNANWIMTSLCVKMFLLVCLVFIIQ